LAQVSNSRAAKSVFIPLEETEQLSVAVARLVNVRLSLTFVQALRALGRCGAVVEKPKRANVISALEVVGSGRNDADLVSRSSAYKMVSIEDVKRVLKAVGQLERKKPPQTWKAGLALLVAYADLEDQVSGMKES
jgi:hypothetical protein